MDMSKQAKWVIPHEHGGWAMVSVPFLLGVAAGDPNWLHVPLFLGWMFFYLASYPLLQALKRKSERQRYIKWSIGYFALALASTAWPLIHEPGLFYFAPVLALLLAVNVRFVMKKAERALLNDLCAILSFSIGGAAAYLLGMGTTDTTMLAVVLFSFIYFTGSVFFVKTIFRERGQANWLWGARGYHITLIAVPALLWSPWMMAPYIFPAYRTFKYAGHVLRPMKVGIIEIIGAVQFLVLAASFL